MIRNLKVLGLALVAVCALTAMGASAASAAQFTTEEGAAITGVELGNVKFTVTGQEVFCEDSHYTATAPSAAFASITVTPTYNKCKAKIFGSTISASVTGFGAGGCDYTLYADGSNDLNCTSGDVTVTAGTCVVHIPAQKGLKSIAYDAGTSGGKTDQTLTINITKIKETHTDGFLCPLEGSGTTEEGVLEGSVTATGSGAGGSPVDLIVDP